MNEYAIVYGLRARGHNGQSVSKSVHTQFLFAR